jgi:hypothetical protein
MRESNPVVRCYFFTAYRTAFLDEIQGFLLVLIQAKKPRFLHDISMQFAAPGRPVCAPVILRRH